MGQLTRCCICGTPGAQQWQCVNLRGEPIESPLPTHDGNCRLLEHGVRLAGEYRNWANQHGDQHERALAAWQLADAAWRCRRWVAAMRRRPFAEPQPDTIGEQQLRRAIASFEAAQEERASA